MPTIDDLLNQIKSYSPEDGGSCFGVTDPSELRKAFRRPRISGPDLCPGCENRKRHKCTGKVLTISVKTDEKTGRMKLKRGSIPCECQRCNKKK